MLASRHHTHAYLTGGRRVEILDFIDDHSRLLLSITASRSFSGPAVADELSHLISDFGPPQSTLTDNGLVFTARNAGAKGGRNAFEKLIRNHGSNRKTAGQDTHKPKEKSNDSTKHSNGGYRANPPSTPSTNYNNNSTDSPPTTTPTAHTEPSADAPHTRSTTHPRKPAPTTTPPTNGVHATTKSTKPAAAPSATQAGFTT